MRRRPANPAGSWVVCDYRYIYPRCEQQLQRTYLPVEHAFGGDHAGGDDDDGEGEPDFDYVGQHGDADGDSDINTVQRRRSRGSRREAARYARAIPERYDAD